MSAEFTYTTGDITKDPSQALVNTVNCVGVMGKGVALAFKKAYPLMFKEYEFACKQGWISVGTMSIYRLPDDHSRFIFNFPTKGDWRYPSRMEWIKAGLWDLAHQIEFRGIGSVALPALGCGCGGLDWKNVRPAIERALRPIQGLKVTIYEPYQEPGFLNPISQSPDSQVCNHCKVLIDARGLCLCVPEPVMNQAEIMCPSCCGKGWNMAGPTDKPYQEPCDACYGHGYQKVLGLEPQVCGACECPIDHNGCGCNPPGA